MLLFFSLSMVCPPCDLNVRSPQTPLPQSTRSCVLHTASGVLMLLWCRCLPCWRSRRRWLQLSSHPGMYCLLKPRGMFFFAAHISMLQPLCVCVASASSACGFGRPGVLLSVSAVNNSQLAVRKFHLLTGLPAIG